MGAIAIARDLNVRALFVGRAMLTQRVDDAIRACLDHCRGRDSPLASLLAFVEELRHAGWNDFDRRVVEKAAMLLLGVVIDPTLSGTGPCPNCNWPDRIVLMKVVGETTFRCLDCRHQWQETAA